MNICTEKIIRKFIRWMHKKGFYITDDEGYVISNLDTNRLVISYLDEKEKSEGKEVR